MCVGDILGQAGHPDRWEPTGTIVEKVRYRPAPVFDIEDEDPADILVKLRWTLDHPDEAQQIVANSHERLNWLCGPEYLWACNEVLRRIAQPESNPVS